MDARVRSIALGAVAALVVVSAYALGAGRGDSAAQPAGPGDDGRAASVPDAGGRSARTLALSGTGEATGVPDQLTFRLSARAKSDDVSTALGEAGGTLRRVLAALREAGVRGKDVRTTGLSVRPDYAYYSSGPPVLTGYVATQSIAVLVRELGDAGATITAATRAGGNAVRLSGVDLRIGDREALLAEAREAAVEQARAKAEQYAAATGEALGPVLSVREVGARGGTPTPMAYGGLARDVAGNVPIRAGTEDLKVTVAVVWQLD